MTDSLETTGTQLAQLDRLERCLEKLGDVHDDLQKLRAEIATCRAAADELTALLSRALATPYFTGRAIADLVSQRLIGDMTGR